MASFVRLAEDGRGPVWVNLDVVATISALDIGLTRIKFNAPGDDQFINVKEPPTDIVNKAASGPTRR